MKNNETRTETSEKSVPYRKQKREESILGTVDMIEEINTSVKENVKYQTSWHNTSRKSGTLKRRQKDTSGRGPERIWGVHVSRKWQETTPMVCKWYDWLNKPWTTPLGLGKIQVNNNLKEWKELVFFGDEHHNWLFLLNGKPLPQINKSNIKLSAGSIYRFMCVCM